jgi:hypothetical protein
VERVVGVGRWSLRAPDGAAPLVGEEFFDGVRDAGIHLALQQVQT